MSAILRSFSVSSPELMARVTETGTPPSCPLHARRLII